MSKRGVKFSTLAWSDYLYWQQTNQIIAQKITRLIDESRSSPFSGIGKPEPLRKELSGYWSRRIDKEHRLVYKVTDEHVLVASCRYHYGKS